MSYQVLARKWRPRNFETMVGQEHVLRMLTNALDHQRLHHAYLFTGTRGVGKTTIARIFAKCLNCEKGISSKPCGECSTCTAIDEGRFVDLMEIDAASRTKVEDTRELLDNVHYAPTSGRIKIYLIDEVHMLSTHSFNALLKTLEEPPPHVKFLLATTDPKRLPITILSRCLQFNLKHVTPEQIAKHLGHICTEEKIASTEAALQLIANAADGSLRDALSILDQTIAYCNNNITTEETKKMLGFIEQDSITRLLQALAQQDSKQLFDQVQQLAESAPDYDQVLATLLSTLHQTAVAQAMTDFSPSKEISQLASQLSKEEVQLYYQIALIGKRDLPLAPHPAQGFEMLMLRMLAFKPLTPSENQPPKADTPKKEKITVAVAVANTNNHAAPTPSATHSNWSELLPKLQLSGVALALASNCSLISLANPKVVLALAPKHEALLSERLADRIEQALINYLGHPIKLEIKITDSAIETPAQKHQQEITTKHRQATDSIKSDDNVQKMLDMFNATLDPQSIKAVDTV